MHESSPETIARHIFFLDLVTNPALTIRERCELFLSLYANSLVGDACPVRFGNSVFAVDSGSPYLDPLRRFVRKMPVIWASKSVDCRPWSAVMLKTILLSVVCVRLSDGILPNRLLSRSEQTH